MLRRIFGVKCYSVEKKELYYKFKSEIDSKFIHANFVNSEIGMAWVMASELKESAEYKHPPLDVEQAAMVKNIMENLIGVYEQSYEKWEDGFRKDNDINRDIVNWWFLSNRYKIIKDSMILDAPEKTDLFKMMISIMNNGKEFAANNVMYCGIIGREKAKIIQKFTCADNEFA